MTDEEFDWEAFDRDVGDSGPQEPSAAERAAERAARSVYNASPEEMNPHVLAFMLGAAVDRLGGVLVLTHEDRQRWYNVGMDTAELGEDGEGPLRIFSVLQERE